MEKLINNKLIIGCIIIVIIWEIGKSVRINQLREVNDSKIESIGDYEKKSKIEYIKILDSVK